MKSHRALYALCLAAAAGLYIFQTGYFAWLFLMVVIGFLPLQLLLSLPGLFAAQCTLRLASGKTSTSFTLQLVCPARLAAGRWRAQLVCENLFTGGSTKTSITAVPGETAAYDVDAENEGCGVVRFSLQKVRMLDVAGLFAFPMRQPPAVYGLLRPVCPPPAPTLPENLLNPNTPPAKAEGPPGPGAMREYNDIREYRPGDPIRDIHWKLSAKHDKTMVREGSFSAVAAPRLCFELCGDAQKAADTLGRLEVLSAALCEAERAHTLYWMDEAGTVCQRHIGSRADFDGMLWQALALPLPLWTRDVLKNLPAGQGPVLMVGPATLEVYEAGKLYGGPAKGVRA